ncbi:MAG TPA: hypothetical protein VFQ38_11650 [Longimicrobiales bacterium]|nr:hypothetical protein [Longimicrobiales bacterium]
MRLRDVGLLSAGLLAFTAVPAHAQRGLSDIVRERTGAVRQGTGECVRDRDGYLVCRDADGQWRRQDDGRYDPYGQVGRYDTRSDNYSAAHAELHRRMNESHAAWHRAHQRDRNFAAEHAEYHRRMERAHQAWHDRARTEAYDRSNGSYRRGDDGRYDDRYDDRYDRRSDYDRPDDRHDNGRHLGWEKQKAKAHGKGPRD